MRNAGRAPPLSPSPAWGLGEQLPALPWVRDVHLHKVMLLHPPSPGTPALPIPPRPTALWRWEGHIPQPSPFPHSTMHDFFLLGGTQDPPRAAQGGTCSPAGRAAPRGSFGGTPSGVSAMPAAAFAPFSLGKLVAGSGGALPQHPGSPPFSLSCFLSLEIQK